MQPYSPERRTAVVLCGTGAHGAYHAGVLRALQEAGVKVDVMAGQGVGAGAAALAAIDGAARLWDPQGVWGGGAVRGMYRWKWPVRAAGYLSMALAGVAVAWLLAWTVGFGVDGFRWAFAAFALVAAIASVGLAGALAGGRAARRRADGRWWWRLLGAPVDADEARKAFGDALWLLIRGGSHAVQADRAAIGRRYADVLSENLSQPGFRELMVVVTDLDARRDVVAGFLREPYQSQFMAPQADRERRSEAIDLAGVGRDHTFDVIAGALTPPLICDPQPITYGVDSYWRGETHRLCDRPGACSRLLEELAAAGVSQAIVVSAVAAARAPHRLTAPRLELRQRLGEYLAAVESAALRDGLEVARLRFDSVYVISPSHNPVGAFDLAGAYDEASDRRQDLGELMTRAYEDAYHQFIEPVVGASGDQLANADSVR